MNGKYSELELSRMTLDDIKFKLKIIDSALNSDKKSLEIYVLGGSGALLAGYFSRYTHDIDYIDIDYKAWQGRYLDLLGTQTDILEFTHTSVPTRYKERALLVFNGENLNVYVLSKEDMIVSKLCRYVEKDQNDIRVLIKSADMQKLILCLMEMEKDINNRIPRIKENFLRNVKIFIKEHNIKI